MNSFLTTLNNLSIVDLVFILAVLGMILAFFHDLFQTLANRSKPNSRVEYKVTEEADPLWDKAKKPNEL